ncbi:MAG TPA: vanadium-dependent haloperoxidase [Polyangia bacterium]|nr:vanadium-dependent haloperoxidase [Polyangia bacterium]
MAALLLATRPVQADTVTDWNQIALEAAAKAGLDGNRSSRIMAIVSVAVYDAVNAITPVGKPYHFKTRPASPASADAAAAQAAHDVLVSSFPGQKADLDGRLEAYLRDLPSGAADKANGIAVGAAAAADLIALRAKDGIDAVPPAYTGKTGSGEWRPTPSGLKTGLTPAWSRVTPFVLKAADQFRAPPPPALGSPDYVKALNEVKDLGAASSTKRSEEQTTIAQFWKEDAELPANEMARGLALSHKTPLAKNALIFALVNMAMADARIATWDTKYHYAFWRPVTALNAGPDGSVTAYKDWTPLLETPAHPSYCSGHSATISAGLAVLTHFYGDGNTFSVHTTTKDKEGQPLKARTFKQLSQAEAENGMSRIYGGIHYPFDRLACEKLGHQVAAYVLKTGPHETR